MTVEIRALALGAMDVNCYITGCTEHMLCAVFDPGDSAHLVLKETSAAGWTINHIVNTHGHADHTGGNLKLKEATGAPLSIHKLDESILSHPDMKDMAAYLGIHPSPPPDILLEDGDEVEVCQCLKLKVIHTPGHSPGGACFHHNGFIIAGDTLFRMSIGRYDLPGGDHKTLIKSIQDKLFTLPDETAVYPGHGEPTQIGFEKKNNPFVTNAFFR